MNTLKEFERYARELRRVGFTRKEILKNYKKRKDFWKITESQAIKIINAC